MAPKSYSILLLGSQGQIGQNLLNIAWPQNIEVVGYSKKQLDITNKDTLISVLKSRSWHFVVNTTGFVKVDAAETAGKEPYLVNSLGLLTLATLCKNYGIPLFHYSTDYVYDGNKNSPYTEQDPFNPLNTYGLSKLFGEMNIQATWENHLILRTSWVYSLYKNNFVKTILKKLFNNESITVVNDQIGSPTFGENLACVTRNLIIQILNDPKFTRWGTYHYCGKGITSWYDYACYIKEVLTLYKEGPLSSIEAISTAHYKKLNPGVTERPLYSVLNTHHIESTFGIAPILWQEDVKKLVESSLKISPLGVKITCI